MNNIRQNNNNRRRGRNNNTGGPRPQQGRGGVDQGNRIDSRARGNGAQMIEKYKNLAREAQLSGDRVQMEYYLQFADHYFRVVSDFRARQEESRPQRDDRPNQQSQRNNGGVDDFENEGYGLDAGADDNRDDDGRDIGQNGMDANDGSDDRGNDRQQNRTYNRERAPQRDDRRARAPRERTETPDRPDRDDAEPSVERPRRARRPARAREESDDSQSATIDAAILPPSISRPDNDGGEAAAPAPRVRRPRRVASDVAPAAE